MTKRELLAKANQDGSYSVSYPISYLIEDSFVDFYDDKSGEGFQREETNRVSRGGDVAKYIKRCKQDGFAPRLYELTANARVGEGWNGPGNWSFDPLDDNGVLGILTFDIAGGSKWLSLTDGGTRQLGIQKALEEGTLGDCDSIDVRIFVDLSLPSEISQFFLINDNQKKVRTDLGPARSAKASGRGRDFRK